jgi:hypothetical protein
MNVLKAHRISGDCVAGNDASSKIMLPPRFSGRGYSKGLLESLGMFFDNQLLGLRYRDQTELSLRTLEEGFSPHES